MQSFVVFAAILAVASAASVQYVQYPGQFGQQSVVTSQRLGGNFAYTIQQQPQYVAAGVPTTQYQYVAAPTVAKTAGVPAYYTAGVVPQTAYTTVGNKLVAGVVPQTYTTGYNTLGYSNLGYPYTGAYNGAYNGLYNGVYGNVVVA